MTTVYLCIGTPKTGTTALQSFMRKNEKILNEQGYSFPYMDLGMSLAFADRNAHFLVHKFEKMAKKEAGEIRAKGYQIIEKLAKEYKNIILTDEIIWYRCNQIKNFWHDVVEEFKKRNCKLKVIVYLRRQDLLIQSLWNQHIKVARRNSKTFQECIYGNYFNYFPLDYSKQLLDIAQYVGKENIIVRPYEWKQFEGGSIYSDFFKAAGIALTDRFESEEMIQNVGLKGNYIEIKRVMNEILERNLMDDFISRPILNASIYQEKTLQYSQYSMFTHEEQIEYVRKFEEGNQKVAREFLNRENGKLFYEPVKELPVWEMNPDTMYYDILVGMTEMFCAQEKKMRKVREELSDAREELLQLEKEVKGMHNSMVFRGYRKMRKIIGHS